MGHVSECDGGRKRTIVVKKSDALGWRNGKFLGGFFWESL